MCFSLQAEELGRYFRNNMYPGNSRKISFRRKSKFYCNGCILNQKSIASYYIRFSSCDLTFSNLIFDYFWDPSFKSACWIRECILSKISNYGFVKPFSRVDVRCVVVVVFIPNTSLIAGEGTGLLRLHSTYRHDLKIYSSDEGRVQVWATFL